MLSSFSLLGEVHLLSYLIFALDHVIVVTNQTFSGFESERVTRTSRDISRFLRFTFRVSQIEISFVTDAAWALYLLFRGFCHWTEGHLDQQGVKLWKCLLENNILSSETWPHHSIYVCHIKYKDTVVLYKGRRWLSPSHVCYAPHLVKQPVSPAVLLPSYTTLPRSNGVIPHLYYPSFKLTFISIISPLVPTAPPITSHFLKWHSTHVVAMLLPLTPSTM